MHLAMLVATFFWAANIVAGKEALTGFGPLALAQLRVLGTALVFAGALLAWRGWPRWGLAWRDWLLLALIAGNGITLNQLFFIGGLARTSVSHTALIVALGPVMVLALACLMRFESLTALKFGGMLISFVGVGILTAESVGGANGGHWTGDLLVLAGGAVFAYYTILVKQVVERFSALGLNALTFGMGTLLMAPFSASALRHVGWTMVPARAWWALAFVVVLGSVVPFLLYAWALTALAASRVAAFGYLQPMIATGLGIWLLAEKLTVKVVVGGALILLGVYLTERERNDLVSESASD
jgi:drug/metabolite transporter (DMT)-like permease